jgi:hypothetical protein
MSETLLNPGPLSKPNSSFSVFNLLPNKRAIIIWADAALYTKSIKEISRIFFILRSFYEPYMNIYASLLTIYKRYIYLKIVDPDLKTC